MREALDERRKVMQDKIDAVMEKALSEKDYTHSLSAMGFRAGWKAAIEQLAQAKGFGEDSIEQRCIQEFRLRCELSEHIGKLNAIAEKCGFEGAEAALEQLAQPAQGEAVAWRFRLRGAESWIPSCDEVGAKKLLANSECYEVEPLYAIPPDTVPKAEHESRLRDLDARIDKAEIKILQARVRELDSFIALSRMFAAAVNVTGDCDDHRKFVGQFLEHSAALSAQPSDEVK